ncbi:MAG: hypothetical protein N3B18_09525 [Desulfobacterota bacterium]|nr:hypothetical protein [Thermodesulfobacteriota bacterium]
MYDNVNIKIYYSPEQKKLYRINDPKCIYPQWHAKHGIHKLGGNFAAMVSRKYYEDKGYFVLTGGYYLIRGYRNERESHPGFKYLKSIFGDKKVYDLISEAKRIGLRGGDPDLFIHSKDKSEIFFVEAKDIGDMISENQKKAFPLIEKYLCKVFIAEIRPEGVRGSGLES